MADSRLIGEWLKKADEDLDFGISVVEESPFYAQICFHFHQAAEKYLKTHIIAHGLEFRKIHDLLVLLKLCLLKEPSLQILLDDCKLLNRFYIDTRYPVQWPTNYTKEEALKAKKAAQNIRDAIKDSLKSLSQTTP